MHRYIMHGVTLPSFRCTITVGRYLKLRIWIERRSAERSRPMQNSNRQIGTFIKSVFNQILTAFGHVY